MTVPTRSVPEATPGEMGWIRAVIEAVVAVLVAFALLVWVPNLALTRLSGMARGSRAAIATTWFFVSLGGLAWAGRRLQAHHVV